MRARNGYHSTPNPILLECVIQKRMKRTKLEIACTKKSKAVDLHNKYYERVVSCYYCMMYCITFACTGTTVLLAYIASL